MNLKDPISLLVSLQKILQSETSDFMAYGGLVLSLYGTPRFTKGADLATSASSLQIIAQKIQQVFPLHHLALDAQPFGGLYITRFTLLGEGGKDDFNSVDLISPIDEAYTMRALSRQMQGTLRETPIRIISPEDFILFKLLSTRDVDLEDAKRVLSTLGNQLDCGLIVEEIETLSQTTPQHAIKKRWQVISE